MWGKSSPPWRRKDRLLSTLKKGSRALAALPGLHLLLDCPTLAHTQTSHCNIPLGRKTLQKLQGVRMTSTLVPPTQIGSDPSGGDSSSIHRDTLIYSQDTLRPRAVMHSSDSTTPFIQHTSPIYPASTTSFANSTPFT